MGYYAEGSGGITFTEVLPKDKLKIIDKLLNDSSLEYDIYEYAINDAACKQTHIDLWAHDKYYSDEVTALLDSLANIAQIESGELDYIGEDYSIWRFYFENGRFQEQNGRIVYD